MRNATTRVPTRVVDVGDFGDVRGDTDALTYSQLGAGQLFHGASYAWGYSGWGDAYAMDGRSHGGNDLMYGGDFVGVSGSTDVLPGASIESLYGPGVTYAGDAETMSGLATGGNDTLLGGHDSAGEFMGDAYSMRDASKGGNDVIDMGSVDVSRSIAHYGVGDALNMGGTTHGGADTLSGADVTAPAWSYAHSLNLLAGDAYQMGQQACGGADRVVGGNASTEGGPITATADGGEASVYNYMAGDTIFATEGAALTFGKDVLVGGNANGSGSYALVENLMAGDLLVFSGAGGMKFGADTLYGGSGSGNAYVVNLLTGDNGFAVGDTAAGASDAFLHALPAIAQPDRLPVDPGARVAEVYAADKIFGGNAQAQNYMMGDAQVLFAGDKGGADLLVAGTGADTYNVMVGDANWIQAGATGGNDTLVSGMGDDEMWGDAFTNDGTGGADTFAFGLHNGHDTIHDFQVGKDHIDLTGLHSDPLAPHNFWALQQHMVQVDGGVLILLGDSAPPPGVDIVTGDSIYIVGVDLHDLTAMMFTL